MGLRRVRWPEGADCGDRTGKPGGCVAGFQRKESGHGLQGQAGAQLCLSLSKHRVENSKGRLGAVVCEDTVHSGPSPQLCSA